MARKPNIPQELLKIAEQSVKIANDAHTLRKAQSILFPALFSLNLVATSMAIGRSKASVCRLQAEFRADFVNARSIKNKRGGRRRQNMSLDKEAELLEPFFQEARAGGTLLVVEIHEAYEKAVGKKVPASTVYRMLARHGWRPPPSPPANPAMEQG